jgi:acyl-CoA reductase-like NAD-dependent aldehyde dehydrogenase
MYRAPSADVDRVTAARRARQRPVVAHVAEDARSARRMGEYVTEQARLANLNIEEAAVPITFATRWAACDLQLLHQPHRTFPFREVRQGDGTALVVREPIGAVGAVVPFAAH